MPRAPGAFRIQKDSIPDRHLRPNEMKQSMAANLNTLFSPCRRLCFRNRGEVFHPPLLIFFQIELQQYATKRLGSFGHHCVRL
jgi:hypothetical protein